MWLFLVCWGVFPRLLRRLIFSFRHLVHLVVLGVRWLFSRSNMQSACSFNIRHAICSHHVLGHFLFLFVHCFICLLSLSAAVSGSSLVWFCSIFHFLYFYVCSELLCFYFQILGFCLLVDLVAYYICCVNLLCPFGWRSFCRWNHLVVYKVSPGCFLNLYAILLFSQYLTVVLIVWIVTFVFSLFVGSFACLYLLCYLIFLFICVVFFFFLFILKFYSFMYCFCWLLSSSGCSLNMQRYLVLVFICLVIVCLLFLFVGSPGCSLYLLHNFVLHFIFSVFFDWRSFCRWDHLVLCNVCWLCFWSDIQSVCSLHVWRLLCVKPLSFSLGLLVYLLVASIGL